MTDEPRDQTRALRAHAATFAAQYLTDHSVGSPLGLWLLLALTAPAAGAHERPAVEEALGMGAGPAAELARALIDDPHPAIASALALWTQARLVDQDAAAQWATSLPARAATGQMPTQEQADQWVADVTSGALTEFPCAIDEDSAIVLTSALATDVTWQAPLQVVDIDDLGGPFAAVRGARALRSADSDTVLLVRTDAAGLVAAHIACSSTGLLVISVIADPSHAPAQVHRAAVQVLELVHSGNSHHAQHVSLFDVPTGAGHAFTITDGIGTTHGGEARLERATAILPAWEARTLTDLGDAPGVPAAAGALAALLGADVEGAGVDVQQVAVATFDEKGFAAAAVTAMMIRATSSMASPRSVPVRAAVVQFGRPYAVIAAATRVPRLLGDQLTAPDLRGAPWDGMPVFSAWVTRPAAPRR